MTPPPVSSQPPTSRVWLAATTTAFFLVLVGVIAYPLFASSLFERTGPRGLGAALLALSLVSLAFPARLAGFGIRVGRWPVVGMALLGGAALLTDARLPMLLVPSLGYGIAASIFWGSLSGDTSLIERAVNRIHPYKPDFVADYCRKLTSLWAWFLAAHGAVLAVLAVAVPVSWWEAYTGWVVLPTMLLFSVVEYPIRKTHFRYYPYGGPIDRFFSARFPAEETELGRRSQAYIDARVRARARDSVGES